MVIREFLTRLGFAVDDKNLKKYEAGIDRVKKAITVVGAVATGAAAYGLFNLIKSTISYGEELKKASQITGVQADALERLRLAAQLSEVDIGTLNTALNIFSTNIAKAQSGSKSDMELFSKLGIDANTIKGTEQGLDIVAAKLSKLPDGIKKTALARELFGRSGAELIPFLNDYKTALKPFEEVLKAFKVNNLDDFNNRADAVGDSFLVLSTVSKKLGVVLAGELLPEIQDAQKAFFDFLVENKDLIKVLVKGLAQALILVGKVIGRLVVLVYRFFSGFAKAIKGSKGAFVPIIAGLVLFATILVGIFGWIPLIIAGVFLILDDFLAYLDGAPSLIGDVVKAISSGFSWCSKKIKSFIDIVKNFFSGMIDGLKEKFASIIIFFVSFMTEFVFLFTKAKDYIVGIFDSIIEKIQSFISKAIGYFLKFNPFMRLLVKVNPEWEKSYMNFANDLTANGNIFGETNKLLTNSNDKVSTIPNTTNNAKSVQDNRNINLNQKVEVKIDGSNPELTPEKIGEHVKVQTAKYFERELREADSAFAGAERPSFA